MEGWDGRGDRMVRGWDGEGDEMVEGDGMVDPKTPKPLIDNL